MIPCIWLWRTSIPLASDSQRSIRIFDGISEQSIVASLLEASLCSDHDVQYFITLHHFTVYGFEPRSGATGVCSALLSHGISHSASHWHTLYPGAIEY